MTALLAGTSTSIQYGGLTFGAQDDDGVVWKLTGFDGWGSPDSTIDVQQKPRQRGAWAGDAFSVERYLTVTLLLRAPSATLLNQAIENLSSAVDFAQQPMTVTEAGFTRTVNVRRKGGVIPGKMNSFIAAPSFQVVATDPRKFGTPMVGTTGLPTSSGGLVVPTAGLVVPAAGLIIPAAVTSGDLEMDNPGNETGPVMLRIDGPCTGPQITHVGSGLTLTFASSLVLGAGEYLLIDMEKHTALEQGQASRSRFITSRQWFGLEPGPNTFSFAASGYDAGAQLTVTATPAWR
ncbi:phage distal tail protein [Humibacter ginsenosidimutans]|uniref:Siphovirus-type tail component C-terminal domain-containing protein n=1 Tax=Humibacter ginsenosidimutans TaxID=2599293 RepID=A0A5B8M7Z0_9MICO|nr:hypothetical protein [Humibacter ginsenosidimutans]QDZ15775.1 hypothetical protein FPZ11_14295 [Humibacter ginsenosidimutans]